MKILNLFGAIITVLFSIEFIAFAENTSWQELADSLIIKTYDLDLSNIKVDYGSTEQEKRTYAGLYVPEDEARKWKKG